MRGIHAMIDAHRQRMQSVKQKLGYMPENQPPKCAPRKAPSPFEGPRPRAVIPAISARKVIRKSTASCRLSVSARHVGDDAIMIREQESYQEYRIFVCLENNPLTERIDTQALRVTAPPRRLTQIDAESHPDCRAATG